MRMLSTKSLPIYYRSYRKTRPSELRGPCEHLVVQQRYVIVSHDTSSCCSKYLLLDEDGSSSDSDGSDYTDDLEEKACDAKEEL
jgi:hypothetical protein